MRKRIGIAIIMALIFLFSGTLLSGQVPQMFNYQAVARDGSGNALVSTPLNVRLAVLQGSPTGTLLWEEEHTLSTNNLGLFKLKVGDPSATKVGGSMASFSAIDWTAGPIFFRPSVFYQSTWYQMAAGQVIAVPYALLATDTETKQSISRTGNTLQLTEGGTVDLSLYLDNTDQQTLLLSGNTLSISGGNSVDLSGYVNQFSETGDTLYKSTGSMVLGSATASGSKLAVVSNNDLSTDALFEVKRSDGQTVFAVYPGGVRIYVANGNAKGPKGGFAIGGFNPAKAGYINDLLWVTPDSIRMYINDGVPLKGPKGGFAIGGFNSLKGPGQEFLRITDDSTRLYIKEGLGKGPKGGFAIGGYNPLKGAGDNFLEVNDIKTKVLTNAGGGFSVTDIQTGAEQDYLNLTKQNYFIGHEAGRDNTSGIYNLILGYQAGLSNTTGYYNSFIGYQAGFFNTLGRYNLFLGYQSGYNNVGSTGWGGNYNTFLGYQSGLSNTLGGRNVFLGYQSGYTNQDGSNNVFIGIETGYNNLASNNTFIGNQAGRDNTTGSGNFFGGPQAGLRNTIGNYNVFLGSVAGANNTAGSNNIFIGEGAGNTTSGSSSDILIGYSAARNYISGGSNVIIGLSAGYNFDHGGNNIFIGSNAGYGGLQGDGTVSSNNNIFIGANSGIQITNGTDNIGIGVSTAANITTGLGNVFIGRDAGKNVSAGSGNVHIGRYAGAHETGSNTFYLGTRYYGTVDLERTNSLMYGVFSSTSTAPTLRINAKVGINAAPSASYALYITGSAYASGGTWQASDKRWKTEIIPLGAVADKIMELTPVSYYWRADEYPEMHFSERPQIGLIAQDVEKLFPELVFTDENGYKSVSYDRMTVLVLEAFQEQQKEIKAREETISELMKRVEALERKVSGKE